jgi:AcrR family transcriptional regulator
VALPRTSQAERRARSRAALLEAAARGISRHGYASLSLEQVAAEAGYTRGALYHQFAGKQELALAVIAWVEETWWAEMGEVVAGATDPLHALRLVARRHAVYCRRDVARVMTALQVEFTDPAHPVGAAVAAARRGVVERCAALLGEARRLGLVRAAAPDDVLARAVTGALEGLVISLAGTEPYDEELAERVLLALLEA